MFYSTAQEIAVESYFLKQFTEHFIKKGCQAEGVFLFVFISFKCFFLELYIFSSAKVF